MMHHDQRDDHDLGFAHDIKVMAKMVERRRALKLFAGAGSGIFVASCGGGSGSNSPAVVTVPSTPTPAASPTPTPTPTPAPVTPTAGCIVSPTEMSGPFPGDGSNRSNGSTSNVLAVNGTNRSDIRASYLGSTGVAAGVQLVLTLTVVDVNAACTPLAGYAVYIWQCDATGQYSLYDLPGESYLRGVQTTDANGQVSFTTIVPGCYPGRYPHIHFEVFSSLTAATAGRFAILTSQLAIPSAICTAVYSDTNVYGASGTRFPTLPINRDLVFGDNTAAQIAMQTPVFTGAAVGYTATALLGVAR